MSESIMRGYGHTAFKVADLEKSVEFYEKVFGFQKAFEMRNPETGGPGTVYISVGCGQFLELFYGGKVKLQEVPDQIGYGHTCFYVCDIQKAYDRLVENNAPIDTPIKRGRDTNWQCWTHDPDGNRIELVQMVDGSLQDNFLKSVKDSHEIK